MDSEWFYWQLGREGRSLSGLAKALGLDPSAVSRMLRGERKMSADEQDGIADYLGVSLNAVAARRRGDAAGFAEKGQESFEMDMEGADVAMAGRKPKSDTSKSASKAEIGFLERIGNKMAGTVTIPAGVDITAPADPDWARVYDEDYDYPLHL
ncbi:helix-turn-helix transcriptional regulator [Rhizobium sp. L1K21]|uniref:helix-turn-helix domain-containing protein n=1 Tax=Rhizobium sp. L1K21 TaxID=2954933 RepID=UPI002093FDC8|nr:helix-turn-helix transcriptional regulator [Rhizobium sp. L1K21]MCO6185601.1 helix-turn-helix domain-containing protein [Rhizobium sp. L1K21]